MGQDFGQEREWSEARELDWFLLGEKFNAGMKAYVRDLLEMYRNYPCLYEIDNSWKGFEWMNADDADRSIYTWVRRDENDRKNLLFIVNMTPIRWDNYIVPVPKYKKYKLVLNSDDEQYAGWGNKAPEEIMADKVPCGFQKNSIKVDMTPYTALVYEF